jgi:adenylate kinase
LAAHYQIAHLSSGDMLRAEVARGTKIGTAAADYLSRGDLVPDDLILEMLSGPILDAATHGGYVLDGFPRTLGQAEAAYAVAQEIEGVELQAVVYLRVSQQELLDRLRSRANREGRTDDDEATIAHRFTVFETQTEPLLDFYSRRGILLDIDGEQPVDDVFDDITRVIDGLHV